MVSPVRTLLSSDSISPSEAADSFNAILHSHLTHHGLVKDPKPGLNNSGNAGTHRERGIVALTRRLAKTKNQVRSETGISRPFLTAVRAHNRALKAARQALSQEISPYPRKELQRQPLVLCQNCLRGYLYQTRPSILCRFSISAFQLNLFERKWLHLLPKLDPRGNASGRP